jgi:hypothetical protein
MFRSASFDRGRVARRKSRTRHAASWMNHSPAGGHIFDPGALAEIAS